MTKESIPFETCTICFNSIFSDMAHTCPKCGKRVCTQCYESDQDVCIECAWRIYNPDPVEEPEEEIAPDEPYAITTSGQGTWKLAFWNLAFSGEKPAVVLSEDDVKEARSFLIQFNYPQPADCPGEKCPAYKHACDEVKVCEIAMRMCRHGWAERPGEEVDEDEQLEIMRRHPGEIDLMRVVGACPECGGKVVAIGMWDLQCSECGILMNSIGEDGCVAISNEDPGYFDDSTSLCSMPYNEENCHLCGNAYLCAERQGELGMSQAGIVTGVPRSRPPVRVFTAGIAKPPKQIFNSGLQSDAWQGSMQSWGV